MAESPINPFQLLQGAAESRSIMMAGTQALIETRKFQIDQDNIRFNQGLQLQELDLAKKQQGFNQWATIQKLGMQREEMAMGREYAAERLKTQQALTAYQQARLQNTTNQEVVGSYMTMPIGGSAAEIAEFYRTRNQAAISMDPNVQSVLSEMEATEGSIDEPSDASQTGGMLFDDGLAGGMMGAMNMTGPTLPPPREQVPQAARAVASASVASSVPTGDFDFIYQNISQDIASTIDDPRLQQNMKQLRVQQLQSMLLRSAAEMRDDPHAQKYLNDISPEREAIYTAALEGDETMVRQIRSGSPGNPIYNDEYVRGTRDRQARLQIESKQKELDRLIERQAQLEESGLGKKLDIDYSSRIKQLHRELAITGMTDAPRTKAQEDMAR